MQNNPGQPQGKGKARLGETTPVFRIQNRPIKMENVLWEKGIKMLQNLIKSRKWRMLRLSSLDGQ